jgi:hypothetical protein
MPVVMPVVGQRRSGMGAVLAVLVMLWLAWLTQAESAPAPHARAGLGGGLPASASARALAASPRLTLTTQARRDLQRGLVDGRLVRLLTGATRRHRLAISVFVTGHSKYVAGTTRISRHYTGRAVDVWQVDGRPVTAGNRAAAELVAWLASLPVGQRPTEVGSPFTRFERRPGFFTDRAHRDHVHIGVGRSPGGGR